VPSLLSYSKWCKNAPKHFIFTHKNPEKNFGKGAQSPTQTLSLVGRGHLFLHLTPQMPLPLHSDFGYATVRPTVSVQS